MKACVFIDREKMEVREVPKPDLPPKGLILKVMACGICGSDFRNFHNGLKGGIKNQIIGHEIAGIIEATDDPRFPVGSAVALAPDISCGQCWYCKHGLVNLCENHKMLGTHYPGGYAQYMAIPSEVLTHGFVELIPPGVDFQCAALAETAAAVVACQNRLHIGPGDTVAIIGDGPVGFLHVEVAHAHGASAILLGHRRLSLAKHFSPELLLDNTDPEEAVQAVLKATEGRGADVVILAVPSAAPQNQALKMVRKRGTIVIYGGVPATSESPSLDSNKIHYDEITITGSFSYPSTGLWDALQFIAKKKIHADQYITQVVSLDQVPDIMTEPRNKNTIKIMIDPWK